MDIGKDLQNAFNEGYNKAIDEFVTEICKKYTAEESNHNYVHACASIKQEIANIAEQMKGV